MNVYSNYYIYERTCLSTMHTNLYEKHTCMNFPHLSSNIPSKPAYGVYISQLVRIGRICSNFVQFKLRHYTLTQKLMKQGFWYSGLCMAFRKFARSHVGIITKYGCSVRNHIEEGICLPATDAFLSRNICTRRR